MKFGGFPKAYSNLTYGKLKKIFDSKYKSNCPDADFDEECKKIGVYPPKKKAPKKED